MLSKRKAGQNGEVENYKMAPPGPGSLAGRRAPFPGDLFATPAASSIRMLLAIAAVKDRESRHLDVEQAFNALMWTTKHTSTDPRNTRHFRGGGRLTMAMYGLGQAGRCWNIKLTGSLHMLGFE